MFRVSRDADHTHRGLRGNDSAGPLQVGCCSFRVVMPADARPCRGLQDRGTQRLGSPCCWASDRCHSGRVPRDGHHGPQAGLASLSHQSSQRSIGDNLSTRVDRTATFGDSRRQLLGLKMRVGCSVFAGWGTPRIGGCPLEVAVITRLADRGQQVILAATHAFTLMQSGSADGKGSVEATKNDTSQNPQYSRQFWRGHSSWLIDSPEECRRDLVAPRPRCRTKATGLVAMASSQTSSRRSLVAVTTHQRPHSVFAPERPFRGSRFIRPIHSGV